MKFRLIIWIVLILTAVYGWSSTKVFMHDATSTYNTSYRESSTFIGPSDVTGVTNSAAGPTSGIQMTKTAGGSLLTWISPTLASSVTISGTVTFNGWGLESATACNCGVEVKVIRYTGGAEGSTVIDSEFGTELTTSNVVQSWTGSPTSTAFNAGDQIVIKWLINDAGGTMASGRTVTFHYDGATAGSSGDTWVQFNETIQFNTMFVNGKGATTGSASSLATPSWSATANNAVICGVSTFSTTINSVTDNQSNTFSLSVVQSTASNGRLYVAYLKTLGTGSATYIVTANAAGTGFITIFCAEFHDDANVYTLDTGPTAASGGNSTNETVNLKSVTINDLVIGVSSHDGTSNATAGSGYVIPNGGALGTPSNQPLAFEYRLNENTGGTVTANLTGPNTTWAIQAIAFKKNPCSSTVCMYPTDTFIEKDTITHAGTATATTYTWTNPSTTNAPSSILAWNNFSPFDIRDKKLVYFAGNDSTGGSPIYANGLWLYNSKNKVWSGPIYTSAQNTSTCTADTSTNAENRHVYNQQAWNSSNSCWYFTSGSCSGGLGYDMYSMCPDTGNTTVTLTQISNPATNPGIRQESIMTFVPSAYNGLATDAFILGMASGSGNHNDTWIYNISTNTWTEICFAGATNSGVNECTAPNHDGGGIIFDSWSKKIFMFGGLQGVSGSAACTSNCDWQMDPTNTSTDSWLQMSPTTQLPGSGYTCYGYDTVRDRAIVLTNNGQLWMWQYWNYTWEQMTGVTGGPTLSGNPQNYGCGYDSYNDIFVMFSGDAATTGKGVWQLPFNFDGIPSPVSGCSFTLMGVC